MWLFAGGMPRAGSTLQYQIAAQIVERLEIGQRKGWVAPTHINHLVDTGCFPGISVLKTHVCTNVVSDCLHDGFGKAVYIYRDLRDVVASAMQSNKNDFQHVWTNGVLELCVAQFASWTGQPNTLVSCYEDVMRDTRTEVYRIANHIGCGAEIKPHVNQIVEDLSIDRQRERIVKIGSSDHYHQTALLHRRHISAGEGKQGQWRKILHPGQARQIESKYRDWMRDQGYLR